MNYVEEKYFLTRGKAILFAILLIAIIVVVIFLTNGNKKITNEYKKFEQELSYAAENYLIVNDIKLKKGEEKRINLRVLERDKFIFNELKDKCSGYVIVTNEKNKATDKYEYVYTSYIKCGRSYVTSNYSEY